MADDHIHSNLDATFSQPPKRVTRQVGQQDRSHNTNDGQGDERKSTISYHERYAENYFASATKDQYDVSAHTTPTPIHLDATTLLHSLKRVKRRIIHRPLFVYRKFHQREHATKPRHNHEHGDDDDDQQAAPIAKLRNRNDHTLPRNKNQIKSDQSRYATDEYQRYYDEYQRYYSQFAAHNSNEYSSKSPRNSDSFVYGRSDHFISPTGYHYYE